MVLSPEINMFDPMDYAYVDALLQDRLYEVMKARNRAFSPQDQDLRKAGREYFLLVNDILALFPDHGAITPGYTQLVMACLQGAPVVETNSSLVRPS